MGSVSLTSQIGGIAAAPPAASSEAIASMQATSDVTTSQLVQAMAGFSPAAAPLDQSSAIEAATDGTQPNFLAPSPLHTS
jgi:hypothetical protein